uniref:Guanylate cyclase n=1 Tax=Xiphophorus couchianus TaxID=32473 RepID=A0A3B5MW10_9TELE
MFCWEAGTLLMVLLVLLDPSAGREPRRPGLRRRHARDQERRRPWQNITLAVILPQNARYPWAWPRVGPAVERAVRTVNSDPTLLPDHRLSYVFNSSEDRNGICSESVASLAAVDLKLARDPWAFIGPGCSYAAAPVGLFTAHWDVPMITAGATAVAFYNGVYPSITNTGPTHKKLGRFGLRVCLESEWTEHVALVFSDHKYDDRPCYFAIEGLYEELKAFNISTHHSVFEEKEIDFAQILADIQNSGRVMFVCCSADVFRKLLVHFWRADLPHHEYVFLFIDLFADSLSSGGRSPWERGDEDDAAAKEAFQVVKFLTYQEPQSSAYQQFVSNLKMDARNWFNYSMDDSLMNIIAAGFYDGLMIYARALNETMAASGARPPGRNITAKMWNRTFTGVAGPVQLDVNGDREMDYALWDWDSNRSAYRVVLTYRSSEQNLTKVPGSVRFWLGGTRPLDVPFCGLKNDNPKCLTRTITVHQMASILVCFLITMTTTVAIFIYRRLRLERELVAQLWRISWEDLHMSSMEKVLRSGSRVTLSLRGSNYGSLMTGDGNLQVFAKTGYCKGNIVAIKYSNRKRIELNRKVLFELKHMFFCSLQVRALGRPPVPTSSSGAPPGLQVGQTLSPRLCPQGMVFLHNSVIVSHGKLKSSNCVVDKRFVLKITDYGLTSFRSDPDCGSDAHAYYAQKLWVAPELLRMESPPPQGTQKGDVYSFGIILQEVALRRGAFYLEGALLSPKEIVDRVILGEWPCLRPTVDTEDHRESPSPNESKPEVGQLMQRCWAEESTERPDFNHIRLLLRKHGTESRNNILDNLLSRMEQYANNLEELVEERTQAYHEEKRKAEALLYQILPHSVAEQLKRGETVQAEAFDSVTIYFSDIVGFTALSAESSPMEVVTLLNDLYTCFDAIIDNFDVYKVETIGDAYMVVSGLPVRNGKRHGREIARMALALLAAVRTFRIRHRPERQLELRIGIHSGPVCAGVVGLKMPRYCLFGDTVNTSSRMESTGEALKIHVSAATRDVLMEFNCFQLERRGSVDVKGKGTMTTYWLLGESGSQ